MNLYGVIRDAAGRVIAISEAIEAGDISYAAGLAHDLEKDLVAAMLEDEQRWISVDDLYPIPDISDLGLA